jgi:ferredoxin-type protein NapH
MGYIRKSLLHVYGSRIPRPGPDRMSPAVKAIYAAKRGTLNRQALEQAHLQHQQTHGGKWLRRRWLTLLLLNLLFVLSYRFDVQLLEGALTASRFVGFHMADLNASLQVMLAFKQVLLNLLIGTATVFVIWVLLGGRTFCSWVCPYHLLSEWAESLHLWLAGRTPIRDHPFNRKVRSLFYLLFALLALLSGYTVFETLSPTGILSRALIYGPGIALVWVGLLLLFEILYSRRAWCRYVCPIGVTYAVVGSISPLRVTYDAESCFHEGDCRKICLVPHVLDITIRTGAADVQEDVGADCTRCGMCVDICPTHSLKYEFKGLNRLL